MKKGLLILIAVFTANFLFGQAQRLVLVEEFTQASCGPCASQNPAFNALLSANTDKVVSIKYQTWWPGYDPMYDQNPGDVDIRVPYYGVQLIGVPDAAADGKLIANDCGAYEGCPACFTQADIDALSAVPSPIELSVTHEISADLSAVTFTITMNNVSGAPFGGPGTVVHLVLTEDEINFPFAPGSNGETDFYGVMRKMIPDANGTDMPVALPPGFPVTQTITVPLPTYFYNFNHVSAVCFVQDKASKVVHQAAYSTPTLLVGYPDISLARNTQGPTDICQYDVIPSITVQNEDATPVTAFKANLWQNGSIVATKDWAGTLALGESAVVDFATVALPGIGEWEFDYNVTDLNGGLADYNTLNNLPEPIFFSTVSQTSVGSDFTADFEGLNLGEIPGGSVRNLEWAGNVLTLNTSDGPATLANPIGGFAQSDGALLVGIYNMLAGVEAEYIIDKLDFTGKKNIKVRFDRAYRQYAAENDRLKVEVSGDCGATWSTIFNKAGSTLKTTAAGTAFFYPQTAAQWRRDSSGIIPAALEGKSDVIVKFHVISAFGNNLWLDNINIEGESSVGTIDPALDAATTITPNPTTDNVMVELNLTEASNLTISITDVAGKLVTTMANAQAFAAGQHQLNFNEFAAAGTYFVNIRSENGQTTKRLTVIK